MAAAIRSRFPAASGNAWRWLARWRSSRGCCCWTNRSARWTPRYARACASGCASCMTGMGLTSVFVTHDQAEAMEMADRVAVLRAGRIEQVDVPDTLYAATGQRVRA